MRKPPIEGIASIDCPTCGHVLHDFDPPQPAHGNVRLSARCHACRAEARFEINRWQGETQVIPLPAGPLPEAAVPTGAQ